jgi:DNA-binding IclR family transcriptional regulator
MRLAQQSKPSGVGVISKVFQILEAIQGSPSGLTLKPICEATGVNKSTAHRFLKHLGRDGYVLRTESGAYMIGPRLSQMGARSNHRVTLQAVARPILWELWKSTGETVNLAVLDQGTILYVDVLESPHEFRLASHVGIRRPLHGTGLGKALGAFLPEEQRERALSTVVFQPLTAKTITNMVQFRDELERVRRQGYAVDDEETTTGARCVSAPIFDANHFAVAAVSVSGPVTRVTREQVAGLAAAVMAAARSVSVAMGFPQHAPQSAATLARND